MTVDYQIYFILIILFAALFEIWLNKRQINYVRDNQPQKVMMVTECSMSDNIQVENPNVEFIRPCNMCPHMKKITLPKILDCLENETGEIIMDKEIIQKARIPVERMAAIGR